MAAGRWSAVAAATLALCCGRGAGWVPDFERMLEQPRYDVYERSGFFADERVLRHPPAGTVARDATPGRPLLARGIVDGRAARGVPLPVTPELIAAGRSRFEIFCAVCHGTGGAGGSVVALNMAGVRPPSLRAPRVQESAPGALYRIIVDGPGRMPSFAAELPVRDRWAVVAYVRTLARRGATRLEETPDSARAARRGAVAPRLRPRR